MRAPQFGHKPTSLAHLRRASFRAWTQAQSEPADRREADFLTVLRRDPGFPTSACTWDRIRAYLRGRDVQPETTAAARRLFQRYAEERRPTCGPAAVAANQRTSAGAGVPGFNQIAWAVHNSTISRLTA
jgi:hypothetical protein